jgi:hypothetical protein
MTIAQLLADHLLINMCIPANYYAPWHPVSTAYQDKFSIILEAQ